jgi:glutathione peroxidase
MSAHDFSFTSIDGKPLKLADFVGHPVLVVNTASQCGLTPQYSGLEALWQKYRDRGPGRARRAVERFRPPGAGHGSPDQAILLDQLQRHLPMTSKYPVTGASAHPFYKWARDEAGDAASPHWNFHKYLVRANGELAGAFGSRAAPDDPSLINAIETELKQ